MVHGDDYVSTGMPAQLKWMQQSLEQRYQVKELAKMLFTHTKQFENKLDCKLKKQVTF